MYYEAIFMNKEKKCRDTEDDESVYGWKLASVQQYTPGGGPYHELKLILTKKTR
jgi:hypothetical protein